MKYDFRHLDPRTGLPRTIEREEDRIELMTRLPWRSGYVRMLQNRANLHSVGNNRHSVRLWYNAHTRTLHPTQGAQGTDIRLYRLPNGQRPQGWIFE